MIMKHFTISPLATETVRAGYSPKTLVVVITIVAAGAAVLLGFTNYHKGNYYFVSRIFLLHDLERSINCVHWLRLPEPPL